MRFLLMIAGFVAAAIWLFLVVPAPAPALQSSKNAVSAQPKPKETNPVPVKIARAHSKTTIRPPKKMVTHKDAAPPQNKVQQAKATASNRAGSSGAFGAQGNGVRVDAAYSNPRKLIPLLLKEGAHVVFTDEKDHVIGALSSSRKILAARKSMLDGVPRTATGEVRQYLGEAFPKSATKAFIIWPRSLWQKLLNQLPSTSRYARATFTASAGRIKARITPMPSNKYRARDITL